VADGIMNIQILKSIFELEKSQWDKIIPKDFPFLRFEFLRALEATHCLGARTGWEPCYFIARAHGEVQGALLAYIRNNSFGEYIFDFAWADAFARYGHDYYPKLVCAIPFTPATCPKILVNPLMDPSLHEEVAQKLLSALKEAVGSLSLSSAHALFISPEEISTFETGDFFIRDSFQYHWKNNFYADFDAFLASLRSKRRKEIQRERAQVRKSGVRILRLTGEQLMPEHAEVMYELYISTMEKKAGFDFLTLDFFKLVFAQMKNEILFVLAQDDKGTPVAGAMNYFGPKTLYGRHWGCLAEYRALHFELCYYQGIEFAIERGLSLFEAGAQGEHKFNRGFLPCLTYSAHFIHNETFARGIKNFVKEEKVQLGQYFKYADEHTPFARG
jgi:predicted N-acyltransferase